jgi:hypothetical protein
MAPLAILELVDGKKDMHFSMTARIVARSAILGTKWLSESTRNAMHRIFQSRGKDAVAEFDREVDRQKALLLQEDRFYEMWKKRKDLKPLRDIESRIHERAMYTTSVHNRRKIRELQERDEEKRRNDSHVSEEEKMTEYERARGGPRQNQENERKIEKRSPPSR